MLHYPYVIEPPFDSVISVHHLEIIYHTGYHYNSVIRADTGTVSLSPPSLTENVAYVNEVIVTGSGKTLRRVKIKKFLLW